MERNIHNGEGEVEGEGDTNTSAASNEIKDTEGGEESNVIVKSDSLPVIESTSDTVVGNADEGDNIPITNPNTEDGDETTTECKSGEPPGRQGGVQVQPPEQDQEQVARRSHGSSHANAHAMDIHQRFVPTQVNSLLIIMCVKSDLCVGLVGCGQSGNATHHYEQVAPTKSCNN